MPFPTGVPFHGEILNTNCENATAFTLFGDGGVGELSVANTDIVYVVGGQVQANGTMSVTIFDDQDGDDAVGAGELIAPLAVSNAYSPPFSIPDIPHRCKAGTIPKALASANTALTATIRGIILRG